MSWSGRAGLVTLVLAVGVGLAWLGRSASPGPSTSLEPSSGVVASPSPGAAGGTSPGRQREPAPPPATSAGLAFVINSGGASISLVDVATMAEVRRIPVQREPHHMALTPDHRFLVVGDTVANELLFLDPVTGDVAKRMTVSDPYQFGYSPDGKWFVVNALLRNQIDIFDTATMTLKGRIPAVGMPSHLNFSPDSKTVYVSLQSSDSLIAIDLVSAKPVWKAVVGPTPAGVLWHRGKLLVGIMGADYFAVVDRRRGLCNAGSILPRARTSSSCRTTAR